MPVELEELPEQPDRSTTRRYSGAGLALVITRQLACAKKVGAGGTAPAEQGRDEAVLKPTFASACVLLVDDEPINLLITQEYLIQFGLVADGVSNGQEAVSVTQ